MTALTQDTFPLQHSRDCAAISNTGRSGLGAFWARHRCQAQVAREMRDLRKLDDHLLKDIGLSRSEVGGTSDHLFRTAQNSLISSGR